MLATPASQGHLRATSGMQTRAQATKAQATEAQVTEAQATEELRVMLLQVLTQWYAQQAHRRRILAGLHITPTIDAGRLYRVNTTVCGTRCFTTPLPTKTRPVTALQPSWGRCA